MPSSALLLGATGLVGKELLQMLLEGEAFDHVVVLGRRPTGIAHPKLEERVADLDRLHEHLSAFSVTTVFCCLGTTIKKAGSQEAFREVDYQYPLDAAKLAATAGARQFSIVTAMGAHPDSSVFYNRVKGQVEEAVKQLGLPSVQIFRPSLLLGSRAESRPGEEFGKVIGWLLAWALVGPLRKYRPVEGRTVARAMYVAAQQAEDGCRIRGSDQIAALAAGTA